MYRCVRCGYKAKKKHLLCPRCRNWQSFLEGHGTEVVEKKAHLVEDNPEPSLEFFDEIVGGGLVRGGVYLLYGLPGSGKSTLATQIALSLGRKGHRVIYHCGEEPINQVWSRVKRLGGESSGVILANASELSEISELLNEKKPQYFFVDSLQSLYSKDLKGGPGSPSQLVASLELLRQVAKIRSIGVFCIGHVTKGEELAGPSFLPHTADVLLSLSGDRRGKHRVLSSIKNRFAPVERGKLLRLEGKGFVEESDRFALLPERKIPVIGAVSTLAGVGSEQIPVEIQTLVVEGDRKRVVSGVSKHRVEFLLGILQRFFGIEILKNYSIYVEVTGGLSVSELADLAILLGIYGSYYQKRTSQYLAVGKVNLTGELVPFSDELPETLGEKRLLFSKVLCPVFEFFAQNGL